MNKITLPFPPSVNHAYPTARTGRRYKSKKYKEWLQACPKLPHLFINGKVKITYYFYFPDKRKRDISNYIKVVEDFLVSSKVLEDDNWHIITEFTAISCGIDKDNQRVEIEIDKIDDK